MDLTNEMKIELEKIIVSSVEKEITLCENIEFEIPSSIGDELTVTITTEPESQRSEYDYYVEQMIKDLENYTIEEIIDSLYEYNYDSVCYYFDNTYNRELLKSIKNQIESNKHFKYLTIGRPNDFSDLLDSINFQYSINFHGLAHHIYDEMREVVFKEFNNTITLNDINKNDTLKEWFKLYRSYMNVSENVLDLELLDYLEFSSIYDGIKDDFDKTRTCSQLMDEIRELDSNDPDLSDYELMKVVFDRYTYVFEQDTELIKMLINNLPLCVIKVDDYYVFNTYFVFV